MWFKIIVGGRQLFIDCYDNYADNLFVVEKSKFLKWAQSKPSFHSQEMATRFKVGRKTAAYHLKRYVETGEIHRLGSTRGAVYSVQPFKSSADLSNVQVLLVKKLKGSDAGAVLEEIESRLPLKRLLSQNVRVIFSYALVTILGNAIEHSQSERAWVKVRIQNGIVFLSVEDKGVGIFSNLKKAFGLENELEAAYHLFKGKQTTTPKKYAGQGLFFVSRIADRLHISSHKLHARIDNDVEDFILFEGRPNKGTKIEFSIRARSKQNLQNLFQEFTGENFEIQKNEVRLRMLGDELLSRAQAQKIMAGLESFERITFDFHKVKGIGKAFAEEIFRDFQSRHPLVKLDVINANLSIQFMIARAI